MVLYGPEWYLMVLYCLVRSRLVSHIPVLYCSVGSCMVCNTDSVLYNLVLYDPVWSSMVLHEITDNHASQHEITHNSIRKLEKNKKPYVRQHVIPQNRNR